MQQNRPDFPEQCTDIARDQSGHASGRTPVYSCARRAFDDADEQAAYASEGYVQRYVQLGAGRFQGQITAVDLDGILVYREALNRRVIQSGAARGLSLIWTCGPGSALRCNGVELGPNHAAIVAANAEFEVLSEPTELVAITVTPRAVAELLHESAAGEELRGGVRVIPPELSGPLSMSIFAVLSQIGGNWDLLDDLAWCALARARLQDVVRTIAGLPSMSGRVGREVRFGQIVRRTREQLDRRPADPASIEDLCRRIGVSKRNLHYAFMSKFNTPPMRFLKTLRMSAARRAIRNAEAERESIGDIAARFGFFHPSHFCADYMRHFGELPSATARRGVAARLSPTASSCDD